MLPGQKFVMDKKLATTYPAILTMVLMDTSFFADKDQVTGGSVHPAGDWIEMNVSSADELFSKAVTQGVSFTAVMSPWFWVHFIVTLQVFNEITTELYLDFMHNGISVEEMNKYHEYMSTLNASILSTKQ
jgi:ATP/ADP translocase